MWGFLRKLIPSWNDRQIRKLDTFVEQVNSFEPAMKARKDEELAGMTAAFRKRLAEGETLDEIAAEAFAAVREAAVRAIGQRHFDVQLMGGMTLHMGRIAEMKTGEGKTLVATLPTYLNALDGKGAHLITVNDYLARRDASWMGAVYHKLGMTIGTIQHDVSFQYDPTYEGNEALGVPSLRPISRRDAYRCDITYGTNNEYGFDYLRDNMAIHVDDQVQRELNFAIVDEVDSILIDEARTPLIISGPAEKAEDLYARFTEVVKRLKRAKAPESKDEEPGEGDYIVDEKAHSVSVTEDGIAKVEKMIGCTNLYDPANIKLVHHLNAALKAKELFRRDREYVVERGQVIIVDEFTGRLMPGRRWSDGIHQAVESKEGLKVERENQTLATITFQNYFRLYKKLSGMTGTAETEAREFGDIYKLDVVVMPTNRPMVRQDFADVVFRTEEEKFEAIEEKIVEIHAKKQPILVGTIAIEKSEMLADRMKKRGIPHVVLNAKHHQKEAEIIKDAGKSGSVMIATNMAGRGTDIQLDGDSKALGGLYILGTERHDSRRIDNQLRGRSGRQGDPGISEFYLSMEDDLMRLFGGPRIKALMERLGWERGEPLQHSMITNAIERAQKRVELEHFEARKHILKYDDVMNEQRSIIYTQRQKALKEDNLKDDIARIFEDLILGMVDLFFNEELGDEQWDYDEFARRVNDVFGIILDVKKLRTMEREELKEAALDRIREGYVEREKTIGLEHLRRLEKLVLLQVVDEQWKDHLYNMDHIKEGIHWEGYGGKDPLVQYKLLARDTFNEMIVTIKERVARYLFRLEVDAHPARDAGEEVVQAMEKQVEEQHQQQMVYGAPDNPDEAPKAAPKQADKTGRNDPCPCGSGKKYKKCHGK
jgi:preprotein translocase subunit SecA